MDEDIVSVEGFRYEPLKHPRHIRVLSLRPSLVDSQPIVVSLRTLSLGRDQEPYEALSYTWGAKHGTVPITCDGKPLLVTPNCEAALRHLRLTVKARLIWIDAICIDQQSVEEKNQQVALMGEIYAIARRTVIWLGTGQPGDSNTMRRARIAGKLFYFRTYPGAMALNDKQRKWAAKAIDEEEIMRVRRICANEWFGRIWTMQELILAQSAVFLLGRCECPASALYTYFVMGEALMRGDSHERRLFRLRSTVLEMIDDDVSNRGGSFMSDVTRFTRSPEQEANDIMEMMVYVAALNDASDPRDKVFGMVALLDATITPVILPKVDYSKPLTSVLEDFAYCMVRTTMTLWPLELVIRRSSTSKSDLPSWVPDLRDPRAVAQMAGRGGLRRRVAHSTEMEIPEEGEPGRLPVRGQALAKVAEVYSRMPIPDEWVGSKADAQRLDTLSQWTAIATGLHERKTRNETSSYYLDVVDWLTPFLSYIRREHTPPPDPEPEPETETEPKPKHRRGPLPFMHRFVGPPKVPPTSFRRPKPQKPAKTIQISSGEDVRFDDEYDGAVLFRTACGLLGLCKGDVQPGDLVGQLAGGRYPFLLRKVKGRPRGAHEYELIGTADVSGLKSTSRKKFWRDELVEEDLTAITLV